MRCCSSLMGVRMRILLRPSLMLISACLAWSLVPAATALADGQQITGFVRSRAPGPTPHVRVVCYDFQGRHIPCANSADVAVQEAHRPYREPYVLWPSRYSSAGAW